VKVLGRRTNKIVLAHGDVDTLEVFEGPPAALLANADIRREWPEV